MSEKNQSCLLITWNFLQYCLFTSTSSISLCSRLDIWPLKSYSKFEISSVVQINQYFTFIRMHIIRKQYWGCREFGSFLLLVKMQSLEKSVWHSTGSNTECIFVAFIPSQLSTISSFNSLLYQSSTGCGYWQYLYTADWSCMPFSLEFLCPQVWVGNS